MNEASAEQAGPVVMNAARVREGSKLDVRVLFVAGAALLMLSGAFLWSEMSVPVEGLAIAGAAVVAALTLWKGKGAAGLIAPVAVLAAGLGGGLWYAATKSELLLVGLGVGLIAAVLAVWRHQREPITGQDRIQNVLVWYGFTATAISASWAFYFHFLTMDVAADHIGRRLVLTLAWLAVGVVLVFLSRLQGKNALRDSGFAFIAMAIGKALFYDTTHLSGALRVAGLAAAGAMLLAGAWVTSRAKAEA
jgi:hypothetical protein